jgi:hypothetical protein
MNCTPEIKILSTDEFELFELSSVMNSLVNDNIQLKTDYLQVLSNNLDNEFAGYYSLAILQDEIVAWTYFFIDEHFYFHGVLFGNFEKLYNRFPLNFRTVFISSPITEYNAFHIKKEYKQYEDSLVDILIKEIVKFSKEKRCKLMLIKDHIKYYNSNYVSSNFTHMHFMPGTQIHLECNCGCNHNCDIICETGCSCFDNYLKKLKKKWRANIRNKLNKRDALLSIEVVVASNLSEVDNMRCYELYLQTIKKQRLKHEYISSNYLGACAKTLGGNCKMLIAKVNGNIIGFAQLLEDEDNVINVRMGMDYSCAHDYQLYYHLLYENIIYCVRKKKKHLNLSQTCYRPKLEVGAQLLPLHTFIRFYNPVLQKIFGKIVVNNCKCYSELIQAEDPSAILSKYNLSSY